MEERTETKIRVSILDDHISTLEGHAVLLQKDPHIEVVSKLMYGEELEPALKENPVDVLLLDITVPTSLENKNPYPVLNVIPKLLEKYPSLHILVISMHKDRGLIRAVMDAGASGYIMKDDYIVLKDLGSVARTIATTEGIYFSQATHQLYLKSITAQNEKEYHLSPRQLEVLSLYAAYPDATTADIAKKMRVENSTVRNLLSASYMKLNVKSRAAAVSKARELGLITPYPPEPPK
jgi:DNA-binding NarL/FixJ family response regulator